MAMKSLWPILTIVILDRMNIGIRGVNAFVTTMKSAQSTRIAVPGGGGSGSTAMSMMATSSNSTTATSTAAASTTTSTPTPPPLYLAEGLLAVHKPLTWTSNDVVSYIRGILVRDAKTRGASEDTADTNNNRKKNKWHSRKKKQLIKVGHGGTLDPLASGVLVLGIGKGTTQLQSYLEGDKQYIATCELGYETDTLDCEGKLVKSAPWDHIQDISAVEAIIPKFVGKIQQVPPMYSAIRIDGQRLYEIARGGDSAKAEAVEIPKREIEVYGIQVGTILEESAIKSGIVDGPRYREQVKAQEESAAAAAAAAAAASATATATAEDNCDGVYEEGDADENGKGDAEGGGKGKKRRRDNDKKNNSKERMFNEDNVPSIDHTTTTLQIPQFKINVQCGGGTYIRSLVRDIAYELNTVATMTGLVRTKQGPFVLEDALTKENWTADKIYEALRVANEKMK
ncbi:hypothetical protein ACHAXH_006604 [Discostella pseudostelligera]